ncbi:DGAT1/2-independent enzyme synthesizing storage lipids-like [Pituophis catenifer annectens]|uniref:DGAT1/2-independent enzyme synthesizing storage lipids-like n=1 Tax=Pituophis catenifer annectens TaxID=94852 RepID=UPI00399447B9
MIFSTYLQYLLEEWLLNNLLYIVACSVLLLFTILFAVPLAIVLFFYFSALFLLLYERTRKLNGNYSSNIWDPVRLIIAIILDGYGRLWHGYELHGIENIPDGPGLIIYYHGAVPLDYLCFLAKIFILKRRCCYSIADDCVFIFPGVQALTGVTGIIQNKKEECLNVLKKGKLLGISPGGMREALFSDKSYKLIWHKRKGFAQLAVDMKVPIIPMCTQNIREGYWIFGQSRPLARRLYEYSRIPFLPVCGGFPVKFRTYIGEPILYNPNVTAEELATKTQIALQSLIRKHQQIPGSICRALLERFHKEKKKE